MCTEGTHMDSAGCKWFGRLEAEQRDKRKWKLKELFRMWSER